MIVEVDEYQHKNYNHVLERERLASIQLALGSRRLDVLRINPDHYKQDGKKMPSAF